MLAAPIPAEEERRLALLAACHIMYKLPIEPGSVVGGRWQITREIGRGGVGVVFEAYDPDEQRVAIKVLYPIWAHMESQIGRFTREARVLMRLTSPHVGKLYDVGNLDAEHGGLPYLVLEFLEGLDLGRASRSARACRGETRSPGAPTPVTPSRRRTISGWCTATSSRRTSSSRASARRRRWSRCSTSASRPATRCLRT
jgi:serine/threonine protein kinase